MTPLESLHKTLRLFGGNTRQSIIAEKDFKRLQIYKLLVEYNNIY